MSNLEVMRKKAGWTQEELAEQSGISRSWLGGFERGRPIPEKQRVKLGAALDCDPELFTSKIKTSGKRKLGQCITAVGLLREKMGLTQQVVAARAGIPQQELSRLENGETVPTDATKESIAEALQCRVSEFSFEDDDIAEELTDPDLGYVQRLCYYRTQAKKTLEELAARSGVNRSRISKMENGRLAVAGEEAVALAAALGLLPGQIRSSGAQLIWPRGHLKSGLLAPPK